MSNPADPNARALALVPNQFAAIAARLVALIETAGAIAVNALLVDSSGSMEGDVERVLSLMRETVADMQAQKDAARRAIALIQYFADDVDLKVPPTAVTKMVAPTEYAPRGNTALYGSLADLFLILFNLKKAIIAACAALDKPVPELRFAVVVITDGGESGMTRYRHQELLDLSAQALEEGFTLTAIAIRVDGEELRKQLGFDPGGVVEVDRTDEGFHTATRTTSQTFSGSMAGFRRPRRPAPPPVSPTGTHHGEVVPADEVPTLPRDPNRR